jgi:N-acetylmuramoyl-L-alanine amidase
MKIHDYRNKVARHPTKQVTKRKLTDIRFIVIHHSLTKQGLAGSNAEAYFRHHVVTNNWSIGGYPYVIEPDGMIKWCADLDVVTPHVGDSNRESLGICLSGDFRHEEPTTAQYESLMWLINHLLDELPNDDIKIKGHSEMPGYSWKECPVISMDQVRNDVANWRVILDRVGYLESLPDKK